MTCVFSPQARVLLVKWTMGRQGGQAAFGSSLFWSYTCSSNFDGGPSSCWGELPPLHLNTTAPQHDSDKSESSEIQIITANGTEFEGGEQTIPWEGKKLKKKKKEIWKLPCRYLGTTEFSFFPQTGRRHTWLGPTHKLHCVTSLLPGWARAQPLCPLKCPTMEHSGVGHPKFHRSIETSTEWETGA